MFDRDPLRRRQAGFSMVEMLMVALVMAIGLLGVASMQLIAIKASSGSANLNTAAMLADQVMDSVESEARNCWLNQTSGTVTVAGTEPPNLYYLSKPPTINVTQTFDVAGQPVDASSPKKIFTATVTSAAVTTTGAATGNLMDVKVVVAFTDVVNNSQTIQRNITITRRIIYA